MERKFLFTAIQSDTGCALAIRHGIDPDDPATNAVLLDGAVYLRSDSALAVLSRLPGWRWTRVFRLVPKPVRDRLYSLIARNRCNICHLPNFAGIENVPRLAGQREDYLLKSLRGYKDNSRRGYDAQMADVVSTVPDADFVDLAHFLARQK